MPTFQLSLKPVIFPTVPSGPAKPPVVNTLSSTVNEGQTNIQTCELPVADPKVQPLKS